MRGNEGLAIGHDARTPAGPGHPPVASKSLGWDLSADSACLAPCFIGPWPAEWQRAVALFDVQAAQTVRR